MLTFFDGGRFSFHAAVDPGPRQGGEVFEQGGNKLWLWGEFYGLKERACARFFPALGKSEGGAVGGVEVSAAGIRKKAVADAFFRALPEQCVEEVLRALDGIFAGVLWDASARCLHLFTDRLGLQPLYFWEEGGRCAWSVQMRDFKHLDLTLREDALHCFLDLGHLVGEMSWFEGVRLLPAAVYERRVFPEGQTERRRYWHWPQPLAEAEAPSFEEAVDVCDRLLRAAVRRRLEGGGKSAILLSGGLDSRLVLAAALREGFAPDALTMGMKNGEDLRIARLVCERAGIAFEPRVLDAENWLEGRERCTALSDGLINSLHLHQAPFVSEWVLPYERVLCGIALEATLGGYWQGSIVEERDKLQAQFGEWMEEYGNLEGDFYGERAISFLMDAHVRHITAVSTYLMRQFVERPLVFADRDLLEYVLSLPDSYRRDYRLYFALLRKYYANLFAGIPWAKTGLPVFHPLTPWVLRSRWPGLRTVLYRARDALADYERWVRMEPARSMLENLLYPWHSCIKIWTMRDMLSELHAAPRFARTSRAEKWMRAATAEWWLRYVSLPHESHP